MQLTLVKILIHDDVLFKVFSVHPMLIYSQILLLVKSINNKIPLVHTARLSNDVVRPKHMDFLVPYVLYNTTACLHFFKHLNRFSRYNKLFLKSFLYPASKERRILFYPCLSVCLSIRLFVCP